MSKAQWLLRAQWCKQGRFDISGDRKRIAPHLLHVNVTMRDLRGIDSWILLSSEVLAPLNSAPDELPDQRTTP